MYLEKTANCVKHNPIRAELAWSDHATALGILARGGNPIISLCRKLLEAGHDAATPLEAWRGGTLCLRVRSIGEAAGLETSSKHPHSCGAYRPARCAKRLGGYRMARLAAR